MKTLISFIINMFKKRKAKTVSTANIDKGFYPEILFLINYPYAEYVNYEEI